MKSYKKGDLIFWSFISSVIGFLLALIILMLIVTKTNFIGDKSFFSKIITVKSVLDQSFYEEVEENKLLDGALKGMTAGLGDVYTRYYDVKEWTSLQEQVTGKFTGIGITMSGNKDNEIEIQEVFKGSPAEQAGLQVGDIILSVNGNKVSAENLSQVSEMVKSKDTVEMKVSRNKTKLDFTIKIGEIKVDNLKHEVVDGDLGYIQINTFDNTIAAEFKAALDELNGKKVKGLVIDVRDNPGGNYDQVVEICDYLLGECTIVYTQDKAGKKDIKYSDANQCDLPIVVLMNGNSASASEVLAGALRDNKRAVLIGSKSFGKGLVQATIGFADGSGMAVTIARYYTPSGECIHGKGILPDEVVKGSNKTQMQHAIRKLREIIK